MSAKHLPQHRPSMEENHLITAEGTDCETTKNSRTLHMARTWGSWGKGYGNWQEISLGRKNVEAKLEKTQIIQTSEKKKIPKCLELWR